MLASLNAARSAAVNTLLRTSGATRQCKDVERRAGPSVADIRIGGGARFYAGVWAQLAPDNRHILPTVWTGVTDWRTSEVAARAERPDNLPGAGIKRAEHTFIRTALKKQVSSGSHDRRVVADFPRHSPDRFTRHRIGGLQFSGRLGSWSEWIGLAHVLTQGVIGAWHNFPFDHLLRVALVRGRRVDEACSRRVSVLKPVSGGDAKTPCNSRVLRVRYIFLPILELCEHDFRDVVQRPARLHIDAFDKIVVDERPGL